MEETAAALQQRLKDLVAHLLFGKGAWTDEAVMLADDLLRAGFSGPATVRVANLP